MLDNIYRELVRVLDSKEKAVLITIVKTEGSVPNTVGAKMLLLPDGKTVGTVGGGAPEGAALKEAGKVFETRKAGVVNLELEPGRPDSIDSLCGGKLTLYLEPVNLTSKLVIFGGGHVGFEVCKLGKMLDFQVTVVDDRPEFANADRFPSADTVCKDFVESVKEIKFCADTYVVIVTKGHKHDHIVLKSILELEDEPAYIGMIGSRKKVKTLFEQMLSDGISQEKLKKVFAPVGLDIGGDSPSEIAVSILAEIIRVKYGGTGASLRDI